MLYAANQVLKQFEQHRGSYTFLVMDAEVVNTFRNKQKTRLVCTVDHQLSFQCGLSHLGDGNFFIIINKKTLKYKKKHPATQFILNLLKTPTRWARLCPKPSPFYWNRMTN